MAFCTIDYYLDTLLYTRLLSRGDRCQPFILSLLAFPTSFRWILKAFVTKKCLLARAPNKFGITVDTKYELILKFGFFGNCGSHPVFANRNINLRH